MSPASRITRTELLAISRRLFAEAQQGEKEQDKTQEDERLLPSQADKELRHIYSESSIGLEMSTVCKERESTVVLFQQRCVTAQIARSHLPDVFGVGRHSVTLVLVRNIAGGRADIPVHHRTLDVQNPVVALM